jgi:hypothetical protein
MLYYRLREGLIAIIIVNIIDEPLWLSDLLTQVIHMLMAGFDL